MRKPAVFAGVGLTSLCVLMLQLALTRLFSATMHYHFAFLAIALALFGSGASGVLLYLLDRPLAGIRPTQRMAVAGCAFGLTCVLALIVLLENPISPEDSGTRTVMRLGTIYAFAAVPFFFAGVVITTAVTALARDASRLYLYDLAGAGAGCLLLIPLLNSVGAVNAVLCVATLAALTAVFPAIADKAPGRLAWIPTLVGFGLLVLLTHNLRHGLLDVRHAKGQVEDGDVLFAKWNSFSRITVRGRLSADRLLILIDSDAATTLHKDGHLLDRHEDLATSVEGLAYLLRPAGRTLIIGPGGGRDVMLARLFGSQEVTAVEINPIIALDVMGAEPFHSYSGRLYKQPGVRLVVDEGRSFVSRSTERYDVIQATMVDTWAATAAGAFALTENNLYTVEAFKQYWTHLADGGVLSVTRWHQDPPDQILRLASLTRAALAELGVSQAERHVIVVRGSPQRRFQRAPATFLLKRNPFTEAETRRIERAAAERGFLPLYTPLHRPPGDLTRLLESPDPATVWERLESDVRPTRDNSPFFFHSLRLRNLGQALSGSGEWRKTNLGTFVLAILVIITVLVTLVFIFGPLLLARSRIASQPGRRTLPWLGYFFSLGAGYMLVEVALVQKFILFLGHPIYSLTVVLFSLLAWSGLGSRLSGRLPEDGLPSVLPRLLAAVIALISLYVIGLSWLLYSAIPLPLWLRIVVSVALLAPVGIMLGAPMPTALRMLASRRAELIPWAWGVNGAASVLGSAAALAIALTAGFDQALLTAAVLYLVALLMSHSASLSTT